MALPEGYLDTAGKFQWRDAVPVIAVGKYADSPLSEVPRDYLEWIASKSDYPADAKEIAREALNGRYPFREAADEKEG